MVYTYVPVVGVENKEGWCNSHLTMSPSKHGGVAPLLLGNEAPMPNHHPSFSYNRFTLHFIGIG